MTTRPEVNRREIYYEIADELNIDHKLVRKVVESQYKQLAEHINDENAEDFKLTGIGRMVQKHKPPVDVLKDFEL